MYHRVAAPKSDVHELSVTPDNFAAHVEHLADRHRVARLVDARRPSLRRRVVVTFDDGYADNALTAMPILESRRVPATFFVTAGLVGSIRERWWDELERLVLRSMPLARHLELRIGDQPLVVDVGSAAARVRAHSAIYLRLRPVRTEVVDGVLAQLRSQVDGVPDDEPARFMTADELRAAAQSDTVDIGAHGSSHQVLASLTAEEQADEIVGARHALQELTAQSVRSFAYPFGGPRTFNDETLGLVREAGFELACVGSSGLWRRRTDRYRIPRMVVKNWDGPTFAATVSRWLKA
jgi:peptidoglycan/xylan/chitin deacetylase (PgdA/CDA1 family)